MKKKKDRKKSCYQGCQIEKKKNIVSLGVSEIEIIVP